MVSSTLWNLQPQIRPEMLQIFQEKTFQNLGLGWVSGDRIHPHSQQGLDDPVPGGIPRILKLLENLEKEKIQFLLEQKEEKQEC